MGQAIDTATMNRTFVSNQNPVLPSYSIRETDEVFQIVFDLKEELLQSRLTAFLSSDKKRLHVMGEREHFDSTDEFLWIFSLPKNVDPSLIEVERRDSTFLIQIPKQTFWKQVRSLLDHSEVRAEFAS